MEKRTDARYHFSDRYMGEHTLELFNDHYLNVQSKRLKRSKQFRMELATLDPEPQRVTHYPWQWLAATLAVFASAAYIIYLLIDGSSPLGLWSSLGVVLLLLLLGGGFILAFRYGSERKWVFMTRAARQPLVNIPFDKSHAEEASTFAERLKQAIEHNTDKKGYSRDDLFAGEMRMLRRLSQSGVISSATYDAAKKQMLTNTLHTEAA